MSVCGIKEPHQNCSSVNPIELMSSGMGDFGARDAIRTLLIPWIAFAATVLLTGIAWSIPELIRALDMIVENMSRPRTATSVVAWLMAVLFASVSIVCSILFGMLVVWTYDAYSKQ